MSHLPASLFAGLPLRELDLANNSLSALPATLLYHQTNLEQLDLSGNILTETGLPTNLTADLHNLLRLDLCSNQLGRLPSALTAPLQNLQVLRLCNNALATASLSPDMVNLAELDLSGNQLTSLGPSSLQPFSQLAYLCLARNALTEVHSAAFQGTTGLLVLDLSDNKLAGLPKALKSLSGLQTLDISNDLVTNLDKDTLSQLPSLWRLQMNGNMLSSISGSIFHHLASLQILDLSRNRIERVEAGSLDSNTRLRAVRLDSNRLSGIAGLFSRVPELTWLNVSNNNIEAFDFSLVPLTLSWLDISHNVVEALESFTDLRGSQISYLDASFNRLFKVDSSSFPAALETLLLNDNRISAIAPYTFFHLTKLVKADLSVNEISSFTENSIRPSAEVLVTPAFNLGGNPIACDCHMQWFQAVNQEAKLARYPHITDLESIYCQLMDTQTYHHMPYTSMLNNVLPTAQTGYAY